MVAGEMPQNTDETQIVDDETMTSAAPAAVTAMVLLVVVGSIPCKCVIV